MKITKSQLKRIIREERSRLLREQYLPEVGDIAVIISTGEEVLVKAIHKDGAGGKVIWVEFTDNPGEGALFKPDQLESVETYGKFG